MYGVETVRCGVEELSRPMDSVLSPRQVGDE